MIYKISSYILLIIVAMFLPEIGNLSLSPLAGLFLFLDFLDIWKMENLT